MSRFIRAVPRSIRSMRDIADALGDVGAEERCAHRDGIQRVSEIVRHDRQHVVARAGRSLRRFVEARVLERDRRRLGELVQDRRVPRGEVAAGLSIRDECTERAPLAVRQSGGDEPGSVTGGSDERRMSAIHSAFFARAASVK